MKSTSQSKPKSIVLLSGGLDSRLVCKILQEQSDILAVLFLLPFTGGCCSDKYCVFRFCQKENIKLKIIDCTKGKLFKEYIEMLKHPKYQRGTALNPCIDCHLFMLKKAKQLADKLKIGIIATGEVLNERPLSQNKPALIKIEKEANLEGRLLRPLSAKLLEETEAEKTGKLDRNKFLSIQGRQRKIQLDLAKEYNIEFPMPGGGCLLCEPEYCNKLNLILEKPNLTLKDIQLLKIGRHFLNSQIILGRNQSENEILEKEKGIKIMPVEIGPTALIRPDKKEDKLNLIEEAKNLIKKFSKHEISEFEIKN